MKNKMLATLFTGIILVVVSGCTLPTGGGPGPRVWIDTPLSGDILALSAVVVQSHASSENGTVSAALLVNGVQMREDRAVNPDKPLISFAQAWGPTSPGSYVLEVIATDRDGNIGRSNRVLVNISTEIFIAPLPLCRLDQLVAPVSLEPVEDAIVTSPVHFTWSYPETLCHPASFAVSISEPDGSAEISGIGWGSITYDWHTTFRDWRLPAGACYYWRILVDQGLDGFGPPSDVRRFCIPLVVSIPTEDPILSTLPTLVPSAISTLVPSAIPSLTPIFIFTANANCRQGPSTAYEVATSFNLGEQVTIDGKSADSSWYWALIPNSSAHCWVSSSTGSTQGPTDGLVIVPAPALPATAVPPPQVATATPIPLTPPTIPGGFGLSTKTCSYTEYVVTLQWANVSYESGYRIYRDGILVATLPGNSTAYDDISPDYNAHSYQVQAFNDAGVANSPVQVSAGCVY